MSALTFAGTTLTILPPGAQNDLKNALPSSAGGTQFGRGPLTVEQDARGAVFLRGADWLLSLPSRTRADRISRTAFLIHLPPDASLSRNDSGGSNAAAPYAFGRADLRIDFEAAEREDNVGLFATLFGEEALPAYDPGTAVHRNELAVVDERGTVVGVVAEGMELDHQGPEPPTYDDDADSVIIELDSLRVVNLGPEHAGSSQDDEARAVAVRVKVIRDAASTVLLTSGYVSTGLLMGSTALGKVIKTGASSLKTLIPVASTPWQPTQSQKTSLDKFSEGSKSAQAMTKRAAEVVAQVATSAGHQVVKSASKIIPANTSPAASQSASASWDLLKNTVHAVSNVLDAVTDAGKHLYQDTVEATSELVAHRYGESAGDAYRQSMGAAGTVGLIYFDAKGIGRKAFLKQAAKSVVTNVSSYPAVFQ
ncbi:hypothetical protein HKX48_002412 [Thoreauomyces humboldtii]|nr:hypothetical protein HKX48_002412 [Thoreauomyces humboldtii]